MGQENFIFAGTLAATTLLIGLVYRVIWQRVARAGGTPTGFGGLLAPALLATTWVFQAPTSVEVAFISIFVGAMIYYIDDIGGLSPRARLIVSFLVGLTLSAALLLSYQSIPPLFAVAAVIGAGMLNVVLTNIVNFYDGADLNLATLIALTTASILLFTPQRNFVTDDAITCLAFVLPFSIMNIRPKTIYFGDSGAFVFASFMTLLSVCSFSNAVVPVEAAVPRALPALDTLYVLVIRVSEGHNLLTRHYLHLYQQLSQHYRGFGYLIPQIVNFGLVVCSSILLQAIGLARLSAVLLSMVLVTIPFYLSCRRLLLPSAGILRPRS